MDVRHGSDVTEAFAAFKKKLGAGKIALEHRPDGILEDYFQLEGLRGQKNEELDSLHSLDTDSEDDGGDGGDETPLTEYSSEAEDSGEERCKAPIYAWDLEVDWARIEIPTAHIHGERDPYFEQSRGLVKLCSSDCTFIFDHQGGHEIPRSQEVAAKIAWMIEKLVERAGSRG